MSSPTQFSPAYRNYALAVLFLGYVVNYVDRSILGILLEPIKLDLQLTDSQLGLLGGLAFALFYSTLGVPIAALADRTSRTKILSIAMIVWSAMTAVCGLAQSFMALLLARIGVGVGEAGASPPSHSLISDYFPIEARGHMILETQISVRLIDQNCNDCHLIWRASTSAATTSKVSGAKESKHCWRTI